MKMNKSILGILFLTMLIFSGCSPDVAISTLNPGSFEDVVLNTKTLYEKSLKDGDVYVTSETYTLPGSSTIYIIGVTNEKNISMYQRRISVTSQFDIHFDIILYEDGNFTGGTLINNFNKNRNNIDNSTFDIYSNPTTIDLTGATLLPFSNELKGDKRASLASSEFADYVMKKDTIYILEVTNQNPQAIEAVFTWNWIED